MTSRQKERRLFIAKVSADLTAIAKLTGWNQSDLASELRVSQASVSKILSGDILPSVIVYDRIQSLRRVVEHNRKLTAQCL